jgi:hypothetical protein
MYGFSIDIPFKGSQSLSNMRSKNHNGVIFSSVMNPAQVRRNKAVGVVDFSMFFITAYGDKIKKSALPTLVLEFFCYAKVR